MPPRKSKSTKSARKSSKAAKARPSRVRAAKARALKPAKRSPARPKAPANPVAARMTAFSEKVLEEEEEPVAVRSFTEARAGQKGSKEYVPKTGQVVERDEDEEEESGDEPLPTTTRPRMDPLTGPLAVPRDSELEFKVQAQPKVAKKGSKRAERPEEFGMVELRQATASGGRHLTRSKPENLQAGASRIQPLTTPEAAAGKKKSARQDRFEVASDARPAPERRMPDLMDFGEVEVGQQTRSGSRKVGRLDLDEDEKEKGKKASKR